MYAIEYIGEKLSELTIVRAYSGGGGRVEPLAQDAWGGGDPSIPHFFKIKYVIRGVTSRPNIVQELTLISLC